MPHGDSNWKSDFGDSRPMQIRAAREQIEAARRRQERIRAPLPVLARYSIQRELHRGGQGTVYLAVQESTGREVAVKILGRGPAPGSVGLARFEREVESLSLLKHPNVVTIHDCGRDHDSVYLVMDYVRGRPLDVYIGAERASTRGTLELFAKVCDGVNAAHLRGVIHRDLKPGNILVDEQGEPRVLDFGLAKLAEPAGDDSTVQLTMTETGQFVGSLPWASPEQAEGRGDGLDIRTDVYSLGVMLYQALTGRFPYPVSGNVVEVARHIAQTTPAPPVGVREGGIDRELETILFKCLAKEPERRYQSAGEVAQDIRRYLAGEPIEARRDSPAYVMGKRLERYRVAAVVGAVMLAVVSVALAVSLTQWGRAERQGKIALQKTKAAQESAQRAERAQKRSEELLRGSYIAQARLMRERGGAGRRFDALDTLRKAATMRFTPEVRDEAIACLVLPDLAVEREFAGSKLVSARGLDRVDRVAIAGEGALRITLVDSGLALCSIPTLDLEVGWMRFSPSGGHVAAAFLRRDGRGGGIIVWGVPSGDTVLRLDAPRPSARFTLGGTPGHEWLARIEARAGGGSEAIVSELPSLRERVRFQVAAGAWALQPDPGGARLVVTGAAGMPVEVYSLESGARLLAIPSGVDVRSPAWSPDGRLIYAGGSDFAVHVWDAASGAAVRAMTGHRGTVTELWLGSRGPLVSSAWDGSIRVWDATTGEPLLAPIAGSECVGSDGERLVLADESTVRVSRWHTDSPARQLQATGALGPLSTPDFSADGRHVAAAGECGVYLWDLGSGERVTLEERPTQSLFFAPALGLLAAVVGRELVVWDVPAPGSVGATRGPSRTIWTGAGQTWASLHPDGRHAVVGSGAIMAVDLVTGEATRLAEGYAGMERPLATRDGRWLFAGTWQGEQARVIDAASGRAVLTFDARSVRGSFSADGTLLAVGVPGLVRIYRLGEWLAPVTVEGTSGEIPLAGASAFSPDGRMLAVSLPPHELRLVEVATGATLARLPNPERLGITALRFSPDGGHLAVTTLERTLIVWDLAGMRRRIGELGMDW